jgi:hypothetical protein
MTLEFCLAHDARRAAVYLLGGSRLEMVWHIDDGRSAIRHRPFPLSICLFPVSECRSGAAQKLIMSSAGKTLFIVQFLTNRVATPSS